MSGSASIYKIIKNYLGLNNKLINNQITLINLFQQSMAQAIAKGVEIPFDLNKIFSLAYDFQPLKEVLEHIFGELKKNSDKIHGVDTKLVTKFMQISK